MTGNPTRVARLRAGAQWSALFKLSHKYRPEYRELYARECLARGLPAPTDRAPQGEYKLILDCGHTQVTRGWHPTPGETVECLGVDHSQATQVRVEWVGLAGGDDARP